MSDVVDVQNNGSSAYRRMFFVGLGGSGGKTLRFLKRDLNTWLRARGWHEGIPQGWQFLHIDTPTSADGAEVAVPMLPDDEYLGLVNEGDTLEDLDKGLFPSHSEHRVEGRSWRVVPESVNVNIQIGAGQYRAIGRSVALAYLRPIRSALRESLDMLNQPDAQASLSKLYTHVHGVGPSTNVAAPIVVVASSLAGGTGAGLINDVCDLLRELDQNAGESFGILYTPDVFHELLIGDQSQGGMNPNSLAAFSEVLNGHWWHGGAGGADYKVQRKTSPVMRSAGAIQSINRTGPAYPFLVGRTNSSGISYASSTQLFEIVGAALTTWATDITVQSEFLAYTVANWRAAATRLKVKPHAIVNKGNPNLNEAGLNAFNALGFSRVSLGNSYFASYAAERLARDAVEFMVDNHTVSGEADNLRMQQPQITAQELIAKQAEARTDAFMRACRLNVIDYRDDSSETCGRPFTEVERALRPPSLQAHFEAARETAENQAKQEGMYVAADWMRWVEPAVRDAAIQFDDLVAPDIEKCLEMWITDTPQLVAAEVSNLVSVAGIHVAQAVIEEVVQRLTTRNAGVVARLREERQTNSVIATEPYWREQAMLQFGNKTTKRIPHGTQVQDAVYYGLYSAVYGVGFKIQDIAADLLEQFVTGFLQPLATALKVAVVDLDADRNKVRSWPDWPGHGQTGSLSDSSRPPMSEYTVVKHESFPQLFNDLLDRSIAAGPAQSHVRRQKSRAAVITGDFLDLLRNNDRNYLAVLENAKPIVISGAWFPDVNRHLSAPRPVANAVFRMGFDAEAVHERAQLWLRQPSSEFNRFISSSLRSYLDERSNTNHGVTAQEIIRRQGDFMMAFESAVEASKPLAELDQQLMVTLFPGESHPHLEVEVSTLPFRDHTLQPRLREMILNLTSKQNVDSYFKSDNQISHVDITTSLAGPYPIIAISSLLAPIAEAWKSLDAGKRADFWDKRRARPLQEFIPAPQEHILCMLRGWFLGRALGLVIPSRNGGTFEVAPRGLRPGLANRDLPRVLLSSSNAWGDEPAVILESLGLAYVDVGVENSLEPLAAYINLFELGRPGSTDRMDGNSPETISDYSPVGDFVDRWIQGGDCGLESGVNMSQYSLVSGVTADERRQNLVETLQKIRDKYGQLLVEYDSGTLIEANALTLPPYWPSMHGLIDKALEQLIAAIRPSDGPGPQAGANFLA